MGLELLLVSWNVTKRCNLRCAHCYLDAAARAGEGELTTAEGFALIDQISQVNPRAMLVLSGGEPLLRPDVLDIAGYAARQGLMVVVGTNGVSIDDALAREMIACGVWGVGISLDSLDPRRHDAFRGVPGSWERAVRGMEACRRNGLSFQVQATATAGNYDEIPALIAFSQRQGAKAFHLFFLVCTGRGQGLTDITPAQYEALLSQLVETGGRYDGMLVRARCAPHLRRIALQRDPRSPLLLADASRCLAATCYCRITPEGDVTPCPYLPIRVGNVRERSFADLWRSSEVFEDLRHPKLKGRCGACEFAALCGGCRARAYAAGGDYLGEDPGCGYQPEPGATVRLEGGDLSWTEEAVARLERVPPFLRAMVRAGVERYARASGRREITPELMQELRQRMGAAPWP